jgi:hypothetical protein
MIDSSSPGASKGQRLEEIGRITVAIQRCHHNYGHFWESIGTAELSDGTKVTLGVRLKDMGLYLFVGEGATQERFVISTESLAQASLSIIEGWLKREKTGSVQAGTPAPLTPVSPEVV